MSAQLDWPDQKFRLRIRQEELWDFFCEGHDTQRAAVRGPFYSMGLDDAPSAVQGLQQYIEERNEVWERNLNYRIPPKPRKKGRKR